MCEKAPEVCESFRSASGCFGGPLVLVRATKEVLSKLGVSRGVQGQSRSRSEILRVSV